MVATTEKQTMIDLLLQPLRRGHLTFENRIILEGGYLYDGRELAPLNETKLKGEIEDLRRRNVETLAITSTF